MRDYIVKRLFLLIPTFFGVTLITFFIIQLAPGSPIASKFQGGPDGFSAERTVSQEAIEATKKLYGLDKPIHIQYLLWVGKIIRLDFGESFKSHRPVREMVIERLAVSLQFGVISILLIYLISVPLGVYSALNAASFPDKIVTFLVFLFYSLPSYWLAIILLTALGGGEYWDVFPVGGLNTDRAENWPFFRWLGDRIYHLVLPITCYTIGGFAFPSRQQRSAVLEVIKQDYIRTAMAKGLSNRTVIFKHTLRNALIPMVTYAAGLIPNLLGSSLLIETIFNIPGLGLLSYEALLARDYPVIMANITISALLVLIGILVSDLLYVVVDPRIHFEKSTA